MNIVKLVKDSIKRVNEKVNPQNDGVISFSFNNAQAFTINSTLNDEQLESFLLLLVNDIGLEYLLILLENLNREQFIRVTDSIKNKSLSDMEETTEDSDKPIAPVIFKNE